ncbi:ABC transporter permease [Demequina sp.]|uniref:ABC transporter permease n=1 Tax=Demequina sp. TaxID=2050685 RepID=UPI003D0B5C9C
MRTALALQVATFARSLTARLGTVLLVMLPAFFAIGMVAVARSSSAGGPSGAKLAPYREGTFSEATASLAGQIVPVVSLITVGFAISWLVGREWADHTLGSLFALSETRTSLAWAKVTVALAWAVACVTLAVGLVGAGSAIFGNGTFTGDVATSLVKVWVAGLVMCALAAPFGWVAVRFRGYLGAVGATIAATAASQILASLGVGAWVPYVAPALWSGAAGPDAAEAISPVSLLLAIAFAAFGAWAGVRAFARARLD